MDDLDRTPDDDLPGTALLEAAALRLMTNLMELRPGDRAAFATACSTAQTGAMEVERLDVAAVWDSLQQLACAVDGVLNALDDSGG